MTPESRMAENLLRMIPSDLDIIDCHGHLGTFGAHYIPYEGNAESITAMMDLAGIKQVCLSHHLVITGDIHEGNNIAYETMLQYPQKFLAYLGYNPNYTVEYNMANLNKYIDKTGVIGLKFHTTAHCAFPDDLRYMPAYELAEEKELVILSHTWGVRDVIGIETAAKKFPNVKIIMGHSGGSEFAAIYEAMRVARENENVYLDLCISTHYEGLVELFVNEVSADKVLFGSDIPFMDPRAGLGRVIFAGISDCKKEKILGGNLKTLLEVFL